MVDGKQYRARVTLYGADGRTVVAAPGETCERVAQRSLDDGWLLEQKLIEPIEAAWRDPSAPADAALADQKETDR